MMAIFHVILVSISWSYIYAQNRPYSQQALTPYEKWSLPESPCPQYFHYETNHYTGSVYGVVPMPKPETIDDYEFELGVNMSVNAVLLPHDGLKIRIVLNQGQILYGENILFQIYFPRVTDEQIPWLNQLKFNGVEVCSGDDPPLNPNAIKYTLWASATIKVGPAKSKSTDSYNTNSNSQPSFSFVMNTNSIKGSGHPNIMVTLEYGGSYSSDIQSSTIGLFNSDPMLDFNSELKPRTNLDSYIGMEPNKFRNSRIDFSAPSPLSYMNQVSKNPFSYLHYPAKDPLPNPSSQSPGPQADQLEGSAGKSNDTSNTVPSGAANDESSGKIDDGQQDADQGQVGNNLQGNEADAVEQADNVSGANAST